MSRPRIRHSAVRRAVAAAAVAGLVGSLLAVPAAAAPSPLVSPAREQAAPRGLADSPEVACRQVASLETASAEDLEVLWTQDYEYIRSIVSTCQKAITKPVKKLKLKRPKVPRTPGQPSFWLYVTGSQVAEDVRSFDLDDPEICSGFASAGGFSFTSTKPGWAVFGPGPVAGGFGVVTDINADVVNRVRLAPAGCGTSDATSGGDAGVATLEVSLDGIRLNAGLGGDLCDGRACPSGWPRLGTVGDIDIAFTAKDRARIKNKRKGVLSFTAQGSQAGGLTSPGACEGWSSGDAGYTCNWAESWSVTVVLVRADTLDFVRAGQRS